MKDSFEKNPDVVYTNEPNTVPNKLKANHPLFWS